MSIGHCCGQTNSIAGPHGQHVVHDKSTTAERIDAAWVGYLGAIGAVGLAVNNNLVVLHGGLDGLDLFTKVYVSNLAQPLLEGNVHFQAPTLSALATTDILLATAK